MSRPVFKPSAESWRRRPAATNRLALNQWLCDPGSLTARVRARCQHFRIQLLSQRRACLAHDEIALLHAPGHSHALVREVLLVADGVPVVFAHSVLLPRHVRGAWHLVAGLGTRPLGAVLFADPSVRRGALHFKPLDQRDHRHQRAVAALPGTPLPATLWARRSVFIRRGRPLLVTEVFLPAILELAP